MAATVARATFPLLAACCSWAVAIAQPTAPVPGADAPSTASPVAASATVDQAATPTDDAVHIPKNPIVWRIPASSQITTMMEIAKVKQQIKEVSKEVATVETKVASKQQEVDSITGAYDGVVAKSRQVTEKLESAEHAVRDSYLAKYMDIRKQIQDLQAAIQARQREKAYKIKNLHKMEEQRAKLQNKYADMAQQQEKILRQQQSIDQFKSENAQMENELEHARAEEQARAAQIAQLKQEIARLEAKKVRVTDVQNRQASATNQLEMQNRDLVGKLKQVNNAKNSIQDTTRKVVG